MELSREAIVEGLQQILGAEHVVTDEQELRERSIDNFRKLETIFGVKALDAFGSFERAEIAAAGTKPSGVGSVSTNTYPPREKYSKSGRGL